MVVCGGVANEQSGGTSEVKEGKREAVERDGVC